MNMKKLIQTMTDIEQGKRQLNESYAAECGDMEASAMPMSAPMPAPENQGNPVTASITLNASGMEHVADLMRLMQQAGLEKAGPAPAPIMPMRMDMENLRDKMNGLEGPPTESIDISEEGDTNSLITQIRNMAKKVEKNPDHTQHRIFAQTIDADLTDLYQMYQQTDATKAEKIKDLVRQNKAATRTANLRNANDIAIALWDIMNSNESFENEPDEEYQDHNYMLDDLAGGLNKPKKMYKPAAGGDNPMAVESEDDYVGAVEHWDGTIVYPKIGDTVELFYSDYTDSDDEADHKPNAIGKIVGKGNRDDEAFIIRWKDHTSGNVETDEFSAADEFRILNKDAEDPNRIKGRKQGQLGLQGGSTKSRRVGAQPKGKDAYTTALHYGESDVRESIKDQLYRKLSEKKAKPDYLDFDGDGDRKEPMKKALADKKKKGPVKEAEKDDDLTNKLFKRKPGELEKLSREKNRKMNQQRFMKPGKPKRSGEWNTYEAEVQEGAPPLSPKFIKQLQITFGDKPMLSPRETRKVEDMIDKMSIENLKQLVSADIPHVSDIAKQYIRNNTPGGMKQEAEVQAPSHELSDTARKATSMAQKIKRKINSGEQMDDRDYNQLAELGAVFSRFGASYGPRSMKDVMNHMKQYTDERNEEGHKYPEFDTNRFKELLSMAK